MLATVLFSLAVALGGAALLRKVDLDPAERLGLGGLLGLGAVGWITFFLLVTGVGVRQAALFGVVVGLIGLVVAWRLGVFATLRLSTPRGASLALLALAVVMLLVPFVGSLAPSDTMDWDSLAYHFAVPKIWIAEGRMVSVPFIHHSFFPFVVDNLYVWGVQWGGEAGAKGFGVMFAVFGSFALFGLARRWFGGLAGWWAVAGFLAMPVVLWEAGTGYIDVAHGLFAGLGVLYAAAAVAGRGSWVVAGLLLGLGAASKYTGLQVCVAVGVVGAVGIALKGSKLTWGRLAAAGGLALVVASPWYVRNVVEVGNPVFPFLYERLGGRGWDEWRAEIYRDEQQTFGVGRTEAGRDWKQLPHAVVGLAYQPGRYVNPGQTEGLGFPTGAIGFACLLGGLVGLSAGRVGRREGLVLGAVGLCFAMWFFLSQQSRYLTALAIPLVVLTAGWIVEAAESRDRWWRWLLGGSVLAQAFYTTWMLKTVQTDAQLPVVLGRQTREDYRAERVAFARPAQALNDLASTGKVALYDEVFGFLLDVPYVWANPGHSTIIPYERLDEGEAFADALADLGFTHVYTNLQFTDPETRRRWLEAMGLGTELRPYSPEERLALASDLRTKWRLLVAEAAAAGRLRPVQVFPHSVIWEVRPK